MFINSLSYPIFNIRHNQIKTPVELNFCGNYNCDGFYDAKADYIKDEIKTQQAENKMLYDFAAKKGRLKFPEYKALGENKKRIAKGARKEIENSSNICKYLKPETAARFALTLKEYLDSKNPEGYRIISVGSSPDTVSGALEFLGCDVTYVPISSLKNIPKRNCSNNTVKNIKDYPNLEKIMRYLDFKKITKENVQRDGRKIIIMDIAHKGSTLKRFYNLLTEYKGINPEQIEQFDFIKVLSSLEKTADSENSLFNKYDLKYKDLVHYSMGEQEGFIGELSSTPHFDVLDENLNNKPGHVASYGKTDEELFKAFEEYSTALSRTYNLIVFDELEKLLSEEILDSKNNRYRTVIY